MVSVQRQGGFGSGPSFVFGGHCEGIVITRGGIVWEEIVTSVLGGGCMRGMQCGVDLGYELNILARRKTTENFLRRVIPVVCRINRTRRYLCITSNGTMLSVQ